MVGVLINRTSFAKGIFVRAVNFSGLNKLILSYKVGLLKLVVCVKYLSTSIPASMVCLIVPVVILPITLSCPI